MANVKNKNNENTTVSTEKKTSVSDKLMQERLTPAAEQGLAGSDNYVSKVWSPDNKNGTYTNPIIYADYSDPDVVRVNNDYYMTASSFTCLPGLPILQSRDMVNWKIIGHALPQYPNKAFDRPQHGKGVWAPSIRYHNDMFYIYWGDPDAGIYMVRAKSPYGPWEEPVLVLEGKGLIDSCPLFDDDGKAYLVHAWAASRAGVNSLLTVYPMNADGTKVIGEGKHVFDGRNNHPTIEGPKFYKRNDYYYIMAPAGGVPNGWQVALRSKSPYGPYEDKIVLEQGSTDINGPHQGGWLQTPTGQSWFIHFQDCETYGRIIHLQPVTWKDDWPLMGQVNEKTGKCEPVTTFKKPDIPGRLPIVNPVESDEFQANELGLQWQWQANPKLPWYSLLPDAEHLRLYAQKMPPDAVSLWDMGSILLQKFPAPDFTATTKVTFMPKEQPERAGLIVMGLDYACLSINAAENGLKLTQGTCLKAEKGNSEKIIEETDISANTVYLRVKVEWAPGPNAICRFSYSLDGNTYKTLGEPFTAKPGKWIGAKVGLFCVHSHDGPTGGYADVDWFRIEK